MRCRPSRSVTASVPALGLGSAVSATGVHVRPAVGRPRLEDAPRPRAADGLQPPAGCTRMLGWIASIASPVGDAGGADIVHVAPAIGRSLEVHAPRARPLRRLGAAAREERAVGKPHGLVLDRTENAVRQAAARRPRPPAVAWTPGPCPTRSAGVGPTL